MFMWHCNQTRKEILYFVWQGYLRCSPRASSYSNSWAPAFWILCAPASSRESSVSFKASTIANIQSLKWSGSLVSFFIFYFFLIWFDRKKRSQSNQQMYPPKPKFVKRQLIGLAFCLIVFTFSRLLRLQKKLTQSFKNWRYECIRSKHHFHQFY